MERKSIWEKDLISDLTSHALSPCSSLMSLTSRTNEVNRKIQRLAMQVGDLDGIVSIVCTLYM